MQKKLELNDGKITYDFNDAAEFQGKTFIQFHKQTKWKEQVKHQNLTVRNEDWPAVMGWLLECLDMKEPSQETPL